jgi:hypothetical protein
MALLRLCIPQDVIRSTFKALHDVIKAQGDAVKSLERQVLCFTLYIGIYVGIYIGI